MYFRLKKGNRGGHFRKFWVQRALKNPSMVPPGRPTRAGGTSRRVRGGGEGEEEYASSRLVGLTRLGNRKGYGGFSLLRKSAALAAGLHSARRVADFSKWGAKSMPKFCSNYHKNSMQKPCEKHGLS